MPHPVPDTQTNRIISMSTLGRNGRFGNQVFQYAFLKIYARKYGFTVTTPSWIGQYLFGHTDPADELTLPRISESEFDFVRSLQESLDHPLDDFDLCGYFLLDTSLYRPYKGYFLKLFEPLAEIRADLEDKLEKLTQRNHTLIGVHLRRGDFGYENYFIPPNKWYKRWISELWEVVENPLLFIASDEPSKVLLDFRKFHPVTVADLGAALPKAEFYPDFFTLTRCNALAISNSSFSFAASMCNSRGSIFVRPDLNKKRLVTYDPWNSEPVLQYDRMETCFKLSQKYEVLKGKVFNRITKLHDRFTFRSKT